MQRAGLACLRCYITRVLSRRYICRLKQLSVVQIINANSATADLAPLLLAALSAQNIQWRPPEGDCVSANFLSNALRTQQREGGVLGSVSAFPKNLRITNPVKPIDH